MTDPRPPVAGWLRQTLELGPTLLFFVLYMRIKDQTFQIGGTEYSGFIVAALAFVPLILISIAILWRLTGQLSRMQVFTAVMVLVFGGLTAWFNDERFFKMKTTIVYGVMAALLLGGMALGRSPLQWAMGEMVPMREPGWRILTRNLGLMFAALAIGNEIVWRNMSEEAWVKIETFGFPILLMAFLMTQFVWLKDHLIKEDAP